MLVYRHIANTVATSCATEISTEMCKYRQGKTSINKFKKNSKQCKHGNTWICIIHTNPVICLHKSKETLTYRERNR